MINFAIKNNLNNTSMITYKNIFNKIKIVYGTYKIYITDWFNNVVEQHNNTNNQFCITNDDFEIKEYVF